jgi:hypothetical protein
MDAVSALYTFLMTFPSVRFVITALMTIHHSTLGRYLESWAVQKLNDVLPDGGPTEKLVNELYEDVKDL